MKTVKLLDREFRVSIPAEKIDNAIAEIAEKMNKDLAGKNPMFICILNGSFMFASDLMKLITVENAEITFMRLTSYEGMGTTGKVKKLMGFTEDLKDRTVVILEDIIDTGITMENTLIQIDEYKPKEVVVATMLFKPDALKRDVKIDYVGIDIPNDFIVGRGLDYDGIGRNLPDIYTVID
ncbi:hypoxanthine phosphoribosyltransferase [Ancylomarina sp. 16SWW S1-10-2]|uniref:hypoxanthine phosphoribosyltransferase n=1 Tax=Ancylomarina sp. 16SWW S1-10-2 TaxID=2499681 RepID=UPI0012AD47FC|nr:hypoxanthine phosphoribosyltransferase [Ancylomarina sp. 16SWW S1-10-2]MRT91587.1 hypoxanthine phosphoribosyltransferase [Ancylomarina sp. 16SWW S1-10-2]